MRGEESHPDLLPEESPFSPLAPDRVILANDTAIAFYDAFPLSKGHALVVPRVPVVSLFELDRDTQAAVWDTVRQTRELIEEKYAPDGFNIGVNDGKAAGQTVPHAHVHVIPRYADDVPDPRGGIRWVIPGRAAYWQNRKLVTAAILRRGTTVLLTRRAEGEKLAGYWEFPGGKVHERESPEACLARELEEELSLRCSIGQLSARGAAQWRDRLDQLEAVKVIGMYTRLREDITDKGFLNKIRCDNWEIPICEIAWQPDAS